MLQYSKGTNLDGIHFVILAYYKRVFEKGHITSSNKHSMFEIMYVVHGRCKVVLSEEPDLIKQKEIPLNKNEFVFIDSGVPHKLVVEEESKIYHVEFRAEKNTGSPIKTSDFMKDTHCLYDFFSGKFESVASFDYNRVLEVIKAIHTNESKKLLTNKSVYWLQTQVLIMDLLINIFGCAEDDRRNKNSGIGYIKTVNEFIQKNYMDAELSIETIAKTLNLNRTYVQKLFKTHTGNTIGKYINEVRVEKAELLLKTTKKSIVDICFDVGYNNRQNFYLSFKRVNGCNPSEYRQKFQRADLYVFDQSYWSEILSE